jgi:hypothetical protein
MTRHCAAMLLILVSLLLLLGGCREVPTSVKVENGPSFSLRGSGRLAIFTVYAPLSGQRIAFPDGDVASVVWKIRASEEYFKGARVQDLKLTYGKVPNGYEQLVPEQSQVAPPLPPGAVYSFFAETTDAPISSGYFYMDKSGPIQTKVPDLCVMLSQGRKVRVNCKPNSTAPYQEPTNLEEMVQKNRTDRAFTGSN